MENDSDGRPGGREIVIFGGTGHPALAREIAGHIGVPLSPSRLDRFANDCLQVQLQANCRERDVFIIQPIGPPVQENLFELLLMLDAARGASASRISAVIPHFAYARSDKKDAPRISIGARLLADLLVAAGANRVLTMTLHSPQVHGFFSIPVDHLHALEQISQYFINEDLYNTTIVSPDLGNAKVTSTLAKVLGIPMAVAVKERIGKGEVQTSNIIGETRGRDIIIFDDEVAKGSTVLQILELLKAEKVKSIRLVCTHGILSDNATQRLLNSGIEKIILTNTLDIGADADRPEVDVLSVAPLLAAAIGRIHNGESISSLLDIADKPVLQHTDVAQNS